MVDENQTHLVNGWMVQQLAKTSVILKTCYHGVFLLQEKYHKAI